MPVIMSTRAHSGIEPNGNKTSSGSTYTKMLRNCGDSKQRPQQFPEPPGSLGGYQRKYCGAKGGDHIDTRVSNHHQRCHSRAFHDGGNCMHGDSKNPCHPVSKPVPGILRGTGRVQRGAIRAQLTPHRLRLMCII